MNHCEGDVDIEGAEGTTWREERGVHREKTNWSEQRLRQNCVIMLKIAKNWRKSARSKIERAKSE